MAVKKKTPVKKAPAKKATKKNEWELKIGKGHTPEQKKFIKAMFEGEKGVSRRIEELMNLNPPGCQGWLWLDVLWRFFVDGDKKSAHAVHIELLDKQFGRPKGMGGISTPKK